MSQYPKRVVTFVFIFLFLLIAITLGKIYPIDDLTIETEKTTTRSGIEEEGNITVFFCPRDNCEQLLQESLAQAQTSLHCALYDLDLESLKHLFQTKAQQLDVRIVMDDGYIQKFNTYFTKADKRGEMHDKFCIIDQRLLFTGSTNPTVNDVHKNNNNLLITDIPTLVNNYEDEFQELWNGTFKSGKPVKTPLVFVQNTTIQNYFCPEDHCVDHIVTELEKAKSSIYFMTFSFTHENIENILLLKYLDNISVEGIIETRMRTKDSPFQRFNKNGIKVLKDGNPRTMHHKVFIIDEKTVITGSMNPTNNGNKNNDENILIIESEEIAQQYFKEYRRVREEAEKMNSSS
ncbi:DUF1669 domain-containing protein [Candidatus Woesearchaeota archaeon]|nr:DUF1669 domain-containing protein [Candidatus Woesearchaeota archaeon]